MSATLVAMYQLAEILFLTAVYSVVGAIRATACFQTKVILLHTKHHEQIVLFLKSTS